MAKHTLGPWQVYEGRLDEVPDNAMVCDLDNGLYVIAPENIELGDYRKDACLIAAAPDLLEAAKKLMFISKCWYGGNGCEDTYCGYCQLKKAIAKAEGSKNE